MCHQMCYNINEQWLDKPGFAEVIWFMTEHEKMLEGKIYDPFSEGMPEERTQAHYLCREYNNTFETESDKRNTILRELIPDIGENVYLQGPIFFDFGINTSI